MLLTLVSSLSHFQPADISPRFHLSPLPRPLLPGSFPSLFVPCPRNSSGPPPTVFALHSVSNTISLPPPYPQFPSLAFFSPCGHFRLSCFPLLPSMPGRTEACPESAAADHNPRPDAPRARSQVTAEGYCEVRAAASVPPADDHPKIDLWAVAVYQTDVFSRHRRNEDSMALANSQDAPAGPARSRRRMRRRNQPPVHADEASSQPRRPPPPWSCCSRRSAQGKTNSAAPAAARSWSAQQAATRAGGRPRHARERPRRRRSPPPRDRSGGPRSCWLANSRSTGLAAGNWSCVSEYAATCLAPS